MSTLRPRLIPILGLLACAGLSPTAQAAASRCSETAATATRPASIGCSSQNLAIDSGSAGQRKVVFQVPLGKTPSAGWPVVLLFHGSLTRVNAFYYSTDMPFGAYYQGQLIKALLDGGYAVLAPNALTAEEAWQTNDPSYAEDYAASNDRLFFDNLFAAMAAGRFGKLNAGRWYATGISSGGYNTSRMALSFPGRFRALAIHSASYATCVGANCQVPQTLPADHPPTLFVHGLADRVVPWSSMQPYHDRLLYQGIDSALHSEADGGHQWFAASPGKILDWFRRHP